MIREIEIDPDGAMRLAAAIARQWIRELPDELPMVAAWLGLDPHQLRRTHTSRDERPGDGVTTCRQCGAYLYAARPRGLRGRERQFCDDRCRNRYQRRKPR